MKLLYINVGGSDKITSIYKKIFGQIEGLHQAGVNAEGIFISSEINETKQIHTNVKITPITKPDTPLFFQLKIRKTYEAKVESILNNTDADIVYIRYFWASKRVLKAVRSCKKLVVLERNSLLLPEIKASNKKPFKLNLSYLFSQFQDYWQPYINEKLFGHKLNKLADLVVCVTPQIMKYNSQKGTNCYHLGNGITTDNYPKRTLNLVKNKVVFFILDGTSVFAPWTGTERLIESIISYQLQDKVEIHIAGNNNSYENVPFVKNLGYLTPEKINTYISKAHIGTGNLKLFEKGLTDASTLKAREYASRGIPLLLAHYDYDIGNSPLKKYCFQVSNSNEPIPMLEVMDWIKSLNEKNPFHPEEMHQLSIDHLDFNVKMKKLKNKLHTLLEKNA